MAGIRVAIEIDATPEQVWQVVEPVERHVDWMHDAVAIRFTGAQTRGVGTEFLCHTKVGPIKLVDHMHITEWVPPDAANGVTGVMGVRHTGMVTGSGRFTLEPIDPSADGQWRRTRFVWQETLVFPWWLGGPLGAAVGGTLVLRPIWARNLRGLRTLVESR